MLKRLRAFFSTHAWKATFTIKKFLIHWLAVFSILWTFIEFTYFFLDDSEIQLSKPPVWLVLMAGVFIALWVGRPRLTRTIKIKDFDLTLNITVDDIFRKKGKTAIVPTNTFYMHDHVDEGSVQVQLRERCFADSRNFDNQLNSKLNHEPFNTVTFQGQQIKEYSVGTTVRVEPTIHKIKAAFLVVTAELNEYGRGKPNREMLQQGIASVWENIAKRGYKEPLVIPVIGSGRNRNTASRYELIYDILKSFLPAVKQNKFTEELTIVIHPDAYRRNQYSLDEIHEFMRYISKFDSALL